jgi:hypothetical protein
MSKRLQVVLDEDELADIRKAARRQRTTVSEWVRHVLREARRQEPRGSTSRKMEAIRLAARYAFPTADVDQMLSEIEGGYLPGGTE